MSTFLCVHLCPNLPLSMTPFNSSRFLCYSVASFVVSTTSPKKPSASTIIFIKCQDLQHMKKNIRYKGNTNNTFVIIFLKIKNSQRWYFAWENFQWGFCDVSCWSSFCCCIFICRCFFIFVVLHSHFLFDVIPHPSVDYHQGFYTPFYTFCPGHRRVICDTFIFNHSFIFLPRELQSWVGIFYPQAFLTLCSFTDILTCVYQGFPGSRQFFLEVCTASYWSSKHRPGPSVCLIHSNPQTSYSERFSFKFTIYYNELLVVKV